MITSPLKQDSSKWQKARFEIQDLTKKSGGTVAVAFEDLQAGKTFYINEKITIHAASTMKTLVMIEVFRQAEKGRFKLTDSLLIKNEFKSILDSSLYSLNIADDSNDFVYKQIDHQMRIRDLIYQMITVSSNLATNILIDLIDAKNVIKTMKEIGANQIRVRRGVEDN